MSTVEVNHYHALWWDDFDMERSLSAVNAMATKPLARIRILRMDSGEEKGYV